MFSIFRSDACTEECLGVREAVQVEGGERRVVVANGEIRIDGDRFVTFFRGSGVMTRSRRRPARQKSVRQELTRVLLGPRFQCLSRQFQISRDLPVIVERDEEILPVADAITELIRCGDALRCELGRPQRVIIPAQIGMSHRKCGVELDGTLQE